jgi:hypothetical protein
VKWDYFDQGDCPVCEELEKIQGDLDQANDEMSKLTDLTGYNEDYYKCSYCEDRDVTERSATVNGEGIGLCNGCSRLVLTTTRTFLKTAKPTKEDLQGMKKFVELLRNHGFTVNEDL